MTPQSQNPTITANSKNKCEVKNAVIHNHKTFARLLMLRILQTGIRKSPSIQRGFFVGSCRCAQRGDLRLAIAAISCPVIPANSAAARDLTSSSSLGLTE